MQTPSSTKSRTTALPKSSRAYKGSVCKPVTGAPVWSRGFSIVVLCPSQVSAIGFANGCTFDNVCDQRGRQPGSKASLTCYFPFVTIKKRNITARFAMPRADTCRAFGPNGSGRGPNKPSRAGESNTTQTAKMAQMGKYNSVNCSARCRFDPSITAARNTTNGVVIRRKRTAAKTVRRTTLVLNHPSGSFMLSDPRSSASLLTLQLALYLLK